MPDTEFTHPKYDLTDENIVTVLKDTLANAIITRNNVLAKPKPTYKIDNQEFQWAEYLSTLNATITQLQKDIAALSDPFEIDSVAY